ncbi:hypothetical protein COT50_02330 [candidate division WWE3 bacterium CG08_land_8_20_14_0_20_41_10]|uniref:Uncharacterized protein n=1 Tax=candidate division WWE3 bacterium CG08_land_8_20_14_0_20_41_10 TaxID=1975085 RepID=A0A2H0XBQ3_UNCKA|nr:MAG: hypothetical protein COT50_02330 [candidate division WWE3 bacterium CG08_land_8_20_14_0_20_41_10]
MWTWVPRMLDYRDQVVRVPTPAVLTPAPQVVKETVVATPTTAPTKVVTPTPVPPTPTLAVPTPTVGVTETVTKEVSVPSAPAAPAVRVREVELSKPAADMGEWLVVQRFRPPLCDPNIYLGWVENPNDGFVPTGGARAKYDLVLKQDEVAVAWGSDVTVGEKVYGRAVVTFYGPGRWGDVFITDGAYRKGYDEWGIFSRYWREVLICLYKGDWPLASVRK